MNAQRVIQGQMDTALSEVGIDQAKRLGRAISSSNFTEAYSSDLQRAYITAKLILDELDAPAPVVQKDQRLRERCLGDAEGKTFQNLAERAAAAKVSLSEFVAPGAETTAEVGRRAGDFFQCLGDAEGKTFQNLAERAAAAKVSLSEFVAPGAETTAEVGRRAGDFFQDLIKKHRTSAHVHILVVSHGKLLNCLLRHLHDSPHKYQLTNFYPSQAIRSHHNTGMTVIAIAPPSSQCRKYQLNFIKVNDTSHLHD
ncbi:Fructose-2,6-bisphosphatase TIGAR [Pseudolycoriella hygida]|uniref:Fructose-2,6-bisphosphatase TIGAR n=1 Tax=Pseudolycoriella hygida TaxID=35572 RepID=A0A9Q0MY22_9DIPT|nr:Fructose-2,6-bisphosphatase TIGAR [Pseudolycoriella hygida]